MRRGTFFHSFHLYHLTGENASPAAKRKASFHYLNTSQKCMRRKRGWSIPSSAVCSVRVRLLSSLLALSAALQHKNQQDRHDERVDDDRFDEDKAHHHGRADAARGFGLLAMSSAALPTVCPRLGSALRIIFVFADGYPRQKRAGADIPPVSARARARRSAAQARSGLGSWR